MKNELPISDKDFNYYQGLVRSNFEKCVSYLNLFYLRRDEEDNVLNNEINFQFIWDHIVSISYDNANDIGMDAIASKEIEAKDFESHSDKFVGSSIEGIIDNIRNS